MSLSRFQITNCPELKRPPAGQRSLGDHSFINILHTLNLFFPCSSFGWLKSVLFWSNSLDSNWSIDPPSADNIYPLDGPARDRQRPSKEETPSQWLFFPLCDSSRPVIQSSRFLHQSLYDRGALRVNRWSKRTNWHVTRQSVSLSVIAMDKAFIVLLGSDRTGGKRSNKTRLSSRLISNSN